MDIGYHVANTLSISLFLVYGTLCLFADGMVEEFERFGLSRFRRLTGVLEILGALGLAVGYLIPGLTPFAAGGLALLMLLGVGTRIRVRDSLLDTAPAAFFLVLNTFILVRSLQGG